MILQRLMGMGMEKQNGLGLFFGGTRSGDACCLGGGKRRPKALPPSQKNKQGGLV
jgi:hypothetical protein